MKTAGKRLTLYCLLAIAALAVSACKEGRPESDTDTAVGSYVLVSIDGKTMPASIAHGGVELTVRSGSVTIKADHTCSSTTVFVPPSGDEITRTVDATYRQDGSELTMQWNGAGTNTATVDGDTFTMNNEGMIFVYRR